METIEIEGKEYHARPIYKKSTNGKESLEIIGLDPVLDENEEMIPSHICLCSAYESFECCCGAWSRPIPSNDNN